jgi:hypothetical protein
MTRRNTPSPDPDAVAEALDRLAQELAVLRDVLDDIHSELQWANRNRPDHEGDRWAIRRITSMPLDPTAPDWAERLNQFSAADLPAAAEPPVSNQPGRLF